MDNAPKNHQLYSTGEIETGGIAENDNDATTLRTRSGTVRKYIPGKRAGEKRPRPTPKPVTNPRPQPAKSISGATDGTATESTIAHGVADQAKEVERIIHGVDGGAASIDREVVERLGGVGRDLGINGQATSEVDGAGGDKQHKGEVNQGCQETVHSLTVPRLSPRLQVAPLQSNLATPEDNTLIDLIHNFPTTGLYEIGPDIQLDDETSSPLMDHDEDSVEPHNSNEVSANASSSGSLTGDHSGNLRFRSGPLRKTEQEQCDVMRNTVIDWIEEQSATWKVSPQTIRNALGLWEAEHRSKNSWNIFQRRYNAENKRPQDCTAGEWSKRVCNAMKEEMKGKTSEEKAEFYKELDDWLEEQEAADATEAIKAGKRYNKMMETVASLSKLAGTLHSRWGIEIFGFVVSSCNLDKPSQHAHNIFAGSNLISSWFNTRDINITQMVEDIATSIQGRAMQARYKPSTLESSDDEADYSRDVNGYRKFVSSKLRKKLSKASGKTFPSFPWAALGTQLIVHQLRLVGWPVGCPHPSDGSNIVHLSSGNLMIIMKKLKDDQTHRDNPDYSRQLLQFVPWTEAEKLSLKSEICKIPTIVSVNGQPLLYPPKEATPELQTQVVKRPLPDEMAPEEGPPVKKKNKGKSKAGAKNSYKSSEMVISDIEEDNMVTEPVPHSTDGLSLAPVRAPSTAPRRAPSTAPLRVPSTAPLRAPSTAPVRAPSIAPVRAPSTAPVRAPSMEPRLAPPFTLNEPDPDRTQSEYEDGLTNQHHLHADYQMFVRAQSQGPGAPQARFQAPPNFPTYHNRIYSNPYDTPYDYHNSHFNTSQSYMNPQIAPYGRGRPHPQAMHQGKRGPVSPHRGGRRVSPAPDRAYASSSSSFSTYGDQRLAPVREDGIYGQEPEGSGSGLTRALLGGLWPAEQQAVVDYDSHMDYDYS